MQFCETNFKKILDQMQKTEYINRKKMKNNEKIKYAVLLPTGSVQCSAAVP